MKPASIIHVGDVRTELAKLEAGSCQCCVTSPPYWGLRDYGTGTWSGGDASCDHEPPQEWIDRQFNGESSILGKGHSTQSAAAKIRWYKKDGSCRCGAKRTDLQIGSEPTIDEFIATLVEVFRGVKRVLRDDGTLWVNMGDGMMDKQLVGQPWRLAFALQADGWIWRSVMPWVKRSAMPDSCTDRPASALEYMFLFTKKARYYWDLEAIRRPSSAATIERDRYTRINDGKHGQDEFAAKHDHEYESNEGGRAFRNTDLWFESISPPHGLVGVGDEMVGLDVTSRGFPGAHFATFPEKLVEPCLKAGTSAKGCCPECGAAWVRVVEIDDPSGRLGTGYHDHNNDAKLGQRGVFAADGAPRKRTTGWRPGCECVGVVGRDSPAAMGEIEKLPLAACTVLDPFSGSGTTGVVARRLVLSYVGIELNPEYAEMSRRRIANPDAKQPVPDVPGQLQMFSERMDTDG